MKTILTTAAAVLALAAPAFAEGDADAGAKDWKKCKACHAIVDADGEVIEKGGKTGPNLFGVVDRAAASDPDFGKYSDELQALADGGLVWTAEELAKYIPHAREYIGGKTSMTPQKLKDVNNVIAFLAQYGAE